MRSWRANGGQLGCRAITLDLRIKPRWVALAFGRLAILDCRIRISSGNKPPHIPDLPPVAAEALLAGSKWQRVGGVACSRLGKLPQDFPGAPRRQHGVSEERIVEMLADIVKGLRDALS